ncbi:MAG TPA: homoserine O-acetyltransferase [Fimbriimonadaceae bacterium]|nr:homoserine O-acetyltransferase [Fimbriimonadaceae bacterium]HRJ96596.1 homoserine O-acetyltransferase [Fimbriimonadaceae bacterium]
MEPDPALFEENERTAPKEDQRMYFDAGALDLERGGHLPSVTVAYETWGEFDPVRSNAIVICHALSGDSHAIGWWDRLIGPGKAIDTDRYFVIGTNALGGCQGTTGPASLAPDGRRYGSRFPFITVGDMVEVQMRLIANLGIERLLAVAGGSMGGMMALEWTLRLPGLVEKAWITASGRAHNAMQIGYNEAARQAVLRDPKWRSGDYPEDEPPAEGLAVARMIGHLSYLSESSFERKFGRRRQTEIRADADPEQFQVEGYLAHQGDKFAHRFDAGSLIVLSRAIDAYERQSLAGSLSEYLFTSFTSDTLYPSHQSETLHALALAAGCRSEWHDIDLPYGHDAFLLDGDVQGERVRAFLAAGR